MQHAATERGEHGFTLIELLIAIVVVGILTAVAIVSVASLTDKGETSACQASVDAVKSANAVHYANTGDFANPLEALETAGTLELSGEVDIAGNTITNPGKWDITYTPGSPPVYEACP